MGAAQISFDMFEGHHGRPYLEILAGLVGMVVFAVFWSAAIAVDGHWVFGVNTLSDLERTVGAAELGPARCWRSIPSACITF